MQHNERQRAHNQVLQAFYRSVPWSCPDHLSETKLYEHRLTNVYSVNGGGIEGPALMESLSM